MEKILRGVNQSLTRPRRYTGILRDESYKIIWNCEHEHKHLDAARHCATRAKQEKES